MFNYKISKRLITQVLQYLIVGIVATGVEWILFYLFNKCLHWHYVIAVCISYVISTFANWGCGRVLLFRKGSRYSLFYEIFSIYMVSIAGLLLNLLIMWGLHDCLRMEAVLSKIIATCIVFFSNFVVRKLWIYKI